MIDRLVDTTPLRSSAPFRRLWIGTSASAFGGQISLVAVIYQVWELTRSPYWVGAIGLADAVPLVVFGLLGGALADSVDRRLLVLATTTGSITISSLLAAQALTEADSLPLVLGLVAASAGCAALGSPARKTFVTRLLPPDQVAAGVALTHLGFQGAMLLGPAIAGFAIAGPGLPACYLLDAATFGIALCGVASLPVMRPPGDRGRTGIRAIAAGFRYIARRPVLNGSFLSDLAATLLAMPVSLFPAINQERFGGNPETLGVFLSAIAVGGVAAGLLSGLLTRASRLGAIQLAAGATWGLALAGFGLPGPLWVALACLMIAGAADTVAVISRGAIVQLATTDSYRGRVGSVEQIVGVAGPELGNVRGGVVAGMTSASFALTSGGLLCVVVVALIAVTHPALARYASTAPVPAVDPAAEPSAAEPSAAE